MNADTVRLTENESAALSGCFRILLFLLLALIAAGLFVLVQTAILP